MEGTCSSCGASPAKGMGGLCLPCSMAASPSLPAVPPPPTGEYRLCRRCQQLVSNLQAICYSCGYAELGIVPLPDTSQPPEPPKVAAINLPNPYWTCVGCNYEYNMQATCGKCGSEKPAPLPAIPAQPPNPCWTCAKCKYGHNLQARCGKCGDEKPAPVPAQPSNPSWKCQTCCQYNTRDYCEYCAYYTQNQQGAAEAEYWTCQSCGCGNNQSNFCTQCTKQKDGQPSASSATYTPQTSSSQVDTSGSYALSYGDPCQYQQTYLPQATYAGGEAAWGGQPLQADASAMNRYQPAPEGQGQSGQSGPMQPAGPSAQANSGNKPESYHCPACWSIFNPGDGCATCKSKISAQPITSTQPSTSTHPEEQKTEKEGQWMCYECGTFNANLYSVCKECSSSRSFAAFLQKHNMELSFNKKSWICKCRKPNPLESEVCAWCSRRNVLVKAGKKGKGASIGALIPNLRKPKK